jgi:hypothetical protein
MCKDLGITLVIFRYNDKLTEDSVYDRMLFAIRNSEYVPEALAKKSIKNNPAYVQAKKRNAENRKLYYKKMKEKRRNESK